MKSYLLPLIILGVILALISLIVFGGTALPDYSIGKVTNQPISAEWVRGNPQSSVVLVEYSDFQCPACKAYQPAIEKIVSDYGTKIAFVYRHFPLIQIHPNADLAARVAEAAGLQGKFWEMHDLLFVNQEEWSKKPSPQSTFDAYAGVLGLNIEQFKADVVSSVVKQAVANDYAYGTYQAVQGTPSFFLNGTQISPQSYQEFADILDAVLSVE